MSDTEDRFQSTLGDEAEAQQPMDEQHEEQPQEEHQEETAQDDDQFPDIVSRASFWHSVLQTSQPTTR